MPNKDTIATDTDKAPKVFISYSWTNEEHENWVLYLAERLVKNGVFVHIDKWDLKPGNDALAFMEKMVTDKTISKVIIVSDKMYAQKADGREGGVGTETQILTPELYNKKEQNKFVAVVTEKDEDGKACLPAFYKSRLYIDMCDHDDCDELLRWIYNEPLHKRPELGKKPDFKLLEPVIQLKSTSLYHKCLKAIVDEKANASYIFIDYCEAVAEDLELFRIKDKAYEGTLEDEVIKQIKLMLPLRDNILGLVRALSQSGIDNEEWIETTHSLFEKLIPFFDRLYNGQLTNDNYRFFAHELFLHTIAIFIKYTKYEKAVYLLSSKYLYDRKSNNPGIFYGWLKSINDKNRWLELIKIRYNGPSSSFIYLEQSDMIITMSTIQNSWEFWYPVIGSVSFRKHFPIFKKLISRSHFEKVKPLFGVETADEFKEILRKTCDELRMSREMLLGFDPDLICTEP